MTLSAYSFYRRTQPSSQTCLCQDRAATILLYLISYAVSCILYCITSLHKEGKVTVRQTERKEVVKRG